ncbi:MAG: hypothetical protein ACOZIN_03170 [Myxococcota bacterium]
MASCGPRAPGPKPGETLFWKVVKSEVSISNCTDDPSFRDDIQPVAFDENTYLIYRVEKDGTQATALKCETFDTRSCTPSDSGIVFNVAGNELNFTRERKSPIGGEGCNTQVIETWLLTDQGQTLDMEVSSTITLVDDDVACQRVEDQLIQQSPNATGLQGCVVRFIVGGALR